MWDDPVFNPPPNSWLGDSLDDEEFRAYRRHARLTALETLYVRIKALESEAAAWKEAAARGAWMWHQLIDNVPADVRERTLIEEQVNAMDTDFSFCEIIGLK